MYHCTQFSFLKSIIEKGLVPKKPYDYPSQPKGVYLSISPFEWMHRATLGDIARGAMLLVNIKGLELFDDCGEIKDRNYKVHRGFYVKETIHPNRFMEIMVEDSKTNAFVPMQRNFIL